MRGHYHVFDQTFTTTQLLVHLPLVSGHFDKDDLAEKEDDDDDEADSAEVVFDEFEEASSSGTSALSPCTSLSLTLSLCLRPQAVARIVNAGRLPTDDAIRVRRRPELDQGTATVTSMTPTWTAYTTSAMSTGSGSITLGELSRGAAQASD